MKDQSSSLYSVQLYLVWFTKITSNYMKMHSLTRAALQIQKMRTQNHAYAQVHNFHFLSLFSTHCLLLFLRISLSLSPSISLFLSHIHTHKHTYVALINSYRLFRTKHTHTHTRFFFLSSQFDWMHLCVLMQNKAYYTLTYLSKDVT